MGIIQKLLFCDSKPESKIKWKKTAFIEDKYLSKCVTEKDISSIPEDEFLCPKCDLVPEILNINSDKDEITLKCKKHGKIENNINDYYKSLLNSNFSYTNKECHKCNTIRKGKMKYCLICQKPICSTCIDYFHEEHRIHCIPLNEKNNNCIIHHNEKANTYCYDCHKTICKKDKNHNSHKIINTNTIQQNVDKYKKIIMDKNKTLFKTLKFYRLVSYSGNVNIQKQLADIT